ncbi:hypothetical protein, partial [Alcanivorax jadensis]|uniref:hypothetical protein n=1 Tax=Alcanivorax jadensis TaxID=64988 RepID=UPI002357DA7C
TANNPCSHGEPSLSEDKAVRVAPDLSSETCRARIFLIALRAISSLREVRHASMAPTKKSCLP